MEVSSSIQSTESGAMILSTNALTRDIHCTFPLAGLTSGASGAVGRIASSTLPILSAVVRGLSLS